MGSVQPGKASESGGQCKRTKSSMRAMRKEESVSSHTATVEDRSQCMTVERKEEHCRKEEEKGLVAEIGVVHG